MSDDEESLQAEWDSQLFGIQRSVRYHLRRASFFDRLDKTTNMISVIFGSAAVYGILSENSKTFAIAASAAVTIFSSINLVIGSTQRARTHMDFVRQFIELEKRMLSGPTEERLLSIKSDRLTIEASEPPLLHVLNTICTNDVMRAWGHPNSSMVRIGWVQRFLSPFFDFQHHVLAMPADPAAAEPQKEKHER